MWGNATVMDANETYYKIFVTEVDANTTEFLFGKLRHFSLYSLSVRACRYKEGENDNAELCSDSEPLEKRTQKLGTSKVITFEAVIPLILVCVPLQRTWTKHLI